MRKNLRVGTSFLLIILMMLMTMPTAAFAGSISDLKVERLEGNKITLENMTVKITNDDAEVGSEDVIDPTKDMTMRVEFSIPDDRTDIHTGDYLEVVLPEYLNFSELHETEIKMAVEGGSEVVLGNVTVSGNKAILTFTEAVENLDYLGRGGWFSAGLSFDQKMVETSEDKVVVTILGNNFTIDVKPVEEPVDPGYISIEKTGKADKANAEITWTVKTTPSKDDKTYDGYVLKDTLPKDVSFIEDSFEISPSDFNEDNFEFDKDNGTIEYKFDEDITGVQTITYKTTIDKFAENNNKKMNITNNASLSNADTTTSAAVTVTVKPQLISKYGAYVAKDHSVDWTIKVNLNQATLKDVEVTDILASEMTFASVKIRKIGNKRVNIILTNDDTKQQYYSLDGQTVKIHLGNIDKNVELRLNTKLDDTITDRVKNKAFIKWNDEDSSISGGNIGTSAIGTGEINGYIKKAFLTKSADGEYNFKKNEMPWKITINSAEKEIEKATVVELFAYNKDEVSAIAKNEEKPIRRLMAKTDSKKYAWERINFNQKYIEDSLDIEGLTPEKIAKDEAFAVKGQYKVNTISLSPSIEAQVVEVYLGDIDSKEDVRLKTKYTNKKAYGVNSKHSKYTTYNYAYLYYGDEDLKLSTRAKEEHYSYVLDKETETPYNYVDRTITWRLLVNHNALDIEDGIITDKLPKYWGVDGDDFYEIYKGGDVNLGNGQANIDKGEKLTEDEVNALIKNVEITENDDIKTIKFEFNKISDKYVILIKTKLSDEGADKQFSDNSDLRIFNNASMSGSSIVGNQGDWEQVDIKNNLVSKSGALDKDSSNNYTGNATWTIDVNSNSINLPVDDLNKVYVIDKLADYLEPKMDGSKYEIRIWEMNLDDNNRFNGRLNLGTEVDQETVQSGITYENKELRIKLPTTNGSYRIEMVTRLTSDTVTEINNTASLEGVKTEIVSKNETVTIEYAEGGAWANLAGKINITKTAEKTGEVLAGAVFELYELSGDAKPIETFKYKKVTDKDGKITFGRLKSGQYKLVETTAPIGYEIDEDSASRIIDLDTLSKDNRIINLNITNKTLLRAVQLLKTDELGNALEGAEFTLYKNAVADENVVAKIESAVNGSITFKELEMGEYYIAETKVPTGYLPTNPVSVIKAVVDKYGNVSYFEGEHFNNAVEGVPTIENIAYKGNITISKVDKSGNPLKGATFILYDENKDAVKSAVSEGEEGIAKFENVRLGNYTIKETEAPSGYKLSDEVLSITDKDFIKNNVEIDYIVENEKKSTGGGGGGNVNTPSDPEDKPTINIPDEEVPLSEVPDDIKKADVVIKEDSVIIEDENVPLGKLPATGGMAQEIFFGLGAGLAALGAALRRKFNKAK